MQNNRLKQQVISGLAWKFAERTTAQGVSFILSLVLARLLLPSQYGIIALVIVFIDLANVFINNGFGESLIQKQKADEVDYSTTFCCTVLLSVTLYLLLFFTAPAIAAFYKSGELTLVVRVLALQIPLSSVQTIQHAYVSKHMLFKKFFFSTLAGTVVSGAAGIVMAYLGFGVWALVVQYLVCSVIDMLVLFLTVPWRPHLFFSLSSAKQLLGYGWKLMVSQFINAFYGDLQSLLVGKVYSAAELAFYNKGNQFPSLLITNINTSISNVMFPAMSNSNDDVNAVKALTRRSMQVSSYIIFPLMAGLAAVAEPLIRLLLTEKWAPCVPYLQICCIYWLFQPCQTANIQSIKAVGRSDICLRLEVVKKIIGITMLLVTMQISMMAVVIANAVFGGLSMLINIIPNKKLIRYGYLEQFQDIAPAFLLSAVMCGAVWSLTLLKLGNFPLLLLQIVTGGFIYLVGSHLFKIESYQYLLSLLERFLKSRGNVKLLKVVGRFKV